MRIPTRLVLAALAALIVMAMTAGTASARTRIEVSPTTIRATSRALAFGSEELTLSCDVTLNGTLLRLITKRLGEHVGGVTEGRTTNCRNNFGESNNRAIVLPGITLLFSSITGTLPDRITGMVVLVHGRFLLDISALFGSVTSRCLFEGTITGRGRENPVRRLVVESATDPHQPIIRVVEEGGNTRCPTAGTLDGAFALAAEVSIRLLER